MVKSLPTIWETGVQSLGQKNPLRRKCQPTPVFLPGKPMDGGTWQATVHGSQRVRHDYKTLLMCEAQEHLPRLLVHVWNTASLGVPGLSF